MRKTTLWPVLLGLLGLFPTAGCNRQGWASLQQARAGFHQTADAAGVTLVVVETQNGSADVQCDASGQQADVAGDKYASAALLDTARQRLEQIQIVVEREAGKPEVLHVKAKVPRFPDGSAGASFRLRLPADMTVTIRTSNGSAAVTGARRDADVETSNGSIRAEAIGGALLARTSNASITVNRVAGNVEAVSSNGSIDLEQAGRERVHAKTSNARIRAINPRGEVSLISSNGSVELKAGALSPEPRIRIETSNASAHVEVPRYVKAGLRLSTHNARIHADLSGAQITDRKGDENDLSATLNGGGGRIEVETSNGSIQFGLIEGRPAAAEAPASQ